MSYSKPAHRKEREIKIRIDEADFDAVGALASFKRTQKAVLARDIFMNEVRRQLKKHGLNAEEVAACCLGSGLERMLSEATERQRGSATALSFCRPADGKKS